MKRSKRFLKKPNKKEKKKMSKSNVQVLHEITGYNLFGVRQTAQRNPNRFSGLLLSYRQAKNVRSVKLLEKKIDDAIQEVSYVCVISPRHKTSMAQISLLNLDENGYSNLKIVKYLCERHFFLLSSALALVGGYINGNSAQATIHNSYKAKKADYLNSIPANIGMLRLKTYLQTSIDLFKKDQKDLENILQNIKLEII
jgi:hypothetical protein